MPRRSRKRRKSCKVVSKLSVPSSTNRLQLRNPDHPPARPAVLPQAPELAARLSPTITSWTQISKSSMTTRRRAKDLQIPPSCLAVQSFAAGALVLKPTLNQEGGYIQYGNQRETSR